MQKERILQKDALTEDFAYEKKAPSRKLILDSWRRSMDYGLNPNSLPSNLEHVPERFDEVLKENESLIKAAEPEFQRLLQKLYKGNFLLALTDADGILLKYASPDQMEYYGRHPWFRKGASWNEKDAGTNAVALTLLTEESCFLRDDEHFLPITEGVQCFSAPIFRNEYRLIGCLVLISRQLDDIDSNIRITEIYNSVRMIEHRIHSVSDSDRGDPGIQSRQLAEFLSEGMAAIDKENTVVFLNRSAKNLLETSGFVPGGVRLQDLLPASFTRFWSCLEASRKSGSPSEIPVSPVRTQAGHTFYASFRIHPMDSGDIPGGSIIFIQQASYSRMEPRSTAAESTSLPSRSGSAKTCFDDLIGESKIFRDAVEQARLFAHSDLNILLLGETGVGKDLFAQCIHNESRRFRSPYYAMNCAAVPSELLASELFGYAEGAFTGAKRGGNPGKLEITRGGTLLLDEIGDMPFDLQSYLLRAIDSREFSRVGSSEIIEVDSRIIAATNIDIHGAVKEKKFRADLFYRLGNTVVRIPSLRQRREDIPIMASCFAHIAAQKLEHLPVRIAPGFMDTLKAYDFPGNVRELKNIIASSIILARSDLLSEDCLPLHVRFPLLSETEEAVPVRIEHERELLLACLKKYNFNKSKTADALQMSRSTLYRKMQQYGL